MHHLDYRNREKKLKNHTAVISLRKVFFVERIRQRNNGVSTQHILNKNTNFLLKLHGERKCIIILRFVHFRYTWAFVKGFAHEIQRGARGSKLHLLQNTFDRKRISANLSHKPNRNFNHNPNAK